MANRQRVFKSFLRFSKILADELQNEQYWESYATKDDASANKGKGRGHGSNDSRGSDQTEGLLASKNGGRDAGTNSESGGDTQAASDQRGTGGGPNSSVPNMNNQESLRQPGKRPLRFRIKPENRMPVDPNYADRKPHLTPPQRAGESKRDYLARLDRINGKHLLKVMRRVEKNHPGLT